MKIVNLDSFKAVSKVKLDDIEYEVYGLTVNDYLHKGYMEAIDNATDRIDQVKAILAVLRALTNIPEDVLLKQPFHILTALLMVIQGIEPTEDKLFPAADEVGASAEGKK